MTDAQEKPRPRRRAKPARSAVAPDAAARPDRRAAILLSAEALFAERGYAAVSVRDIATRAGVPIALVGYYFGRKPELFGTIFEHRQIYIRERIARIEAVDCNPANAGAVEQLVRAWAEPVISMRGSEAGDVFALLVARTAWDPGPEAIEIIKRFYDPLARAFFGAMQQAIPTCAPDRIVWAYEYAVGALLMYVGDKRIERLTEGRAASADPEQCEDFIRFVTAGFEALR
ncbi:TetR/AcrR family transcriptional regulator [Azorhizobium doebereinerae]|uniref:TetR/AcrR family transcriptional regulator n=1 Tax=Azorhizobium doebereinerae TaxID=281091 RepID=UPI0003F718F6|nr:TetR/AcrR family transcriptional regulator [Azorhizobium doebereinerae]